MPQKPDRKLVFILGIRIVTQIRDLVFDILAIRSRQKLDLCDLLIPADTDEQLPRCTGRFLFILRQKTHQHLFPDRTQAVLLALRPTVFLGKRNEKFVNFGQCRQLQRHLNFSSPRTGQFQQKRHANNRQAPHRNPAIEQLAHQPVEKPRNIPRRKPEHQRHRNDDPLAMVNLIIERHLCTFHKKPAKHNDINSRQNRTRNRNEKSPQLGQKCHPDHEQTQVHTHHPRSHACEGDIRGGKCPGRRGRGNAQNARDQIAHAIGVETALNNSEILCLYLSVRGPLDHANIPNSLHKRHQTDKNKGRQKRPKFNAKGQIKTLPYGRGKANIGSFDHTAVIVQAQRHGKNQTRQNDNTDDPQPPSLRRTQNHQYPNEQRDGHRRDNAINGQILCRFHNIIKQKWRCRPRDQHNNRTADGSRKYPAQQRKVRSEHNLNERGDNHQTRQQARSAFL